jgi:hypothetical protein
MKFSNSRELIKNFLSTTIENEKTDYLKRENSNFIFSNSLLRHQIDNWAEEDYLFSEILNPELIESSKEGYVYIHDKKLQNYCVSVSAKQIAEIGMPSLAKNMLESDSAKNFITLFRHFSNVITFLSQQVSGAIMINNIMTISASYLFIEEVIKGRKYENWLIKQTLQNFIWELNEPLRSGSQTPFSNVTMEFEVDSNLKDQYIIFGGKPVKYKYQDIPQEYLDNINSIFLDVMASGSSKNTPFTFPLITVPYTGDKIRRNPIYLKLLSEMKKWGGCYFENFLPDAFKEGSYYRKLNVNLAPKDPEISRSMCPVDRKERVLIKSNRYNNRIENILIGSLEFGKEYEILSGNKFVKGTFNKFTGNCLYKTTLFNGLSFKSLDIHDNFVYNSKTKKYETIKTKDLKNYMYLPVNDKELETTDAGTYDLGYLVGAFGGDGSFPNNGLRASFHLHQTQKQEIKENLIRIIKNYFTESYNIYQDKESLCETISFNSTALVGYITGFFKKEKNGDKNYKDEIFSMSKEFRKGLIDGHLATDGSASQPRIYMKSKRMRDTLTALCNTLGIPVSHRVDKRENYSKDPVYCIWMYRSLGRNTKYSTKTEKDIWLKQDNLFLVKIKQNKINKKQTKTGYCFTINENEKTKLFTLSNSGIMTHNCRLNIPIKELQKLGAGIFGSTVGNTGAVQVLNLNLNRLLMEFVPDDFKDRYEELQAHILENGVEGTVNSSARNYFDEYLLTPLYKKMDYLLEVMQKGHMEKRKWLEEYKTLFPNFFAYNTDLKNYFNVFSIIGVHEGLINIGIPDGIKHPVGKVISHLILQKITKKIGEFTERDQVACGIEYAPKLVGVK